jgi:hypothetical protein
MIVGLIDTEICCGMEMNVERMSGHDYGRSKTTGHCGIFQLSV